MRKYYNIYKFRSHYYKPKEIYNFLKANAKRKKLKLAFSHQDFFNWYKKQHQRCQSNYFTEKEMLLIGKFLKYRIWKYRKSC